MGYSVYLSARQFTTGVGQPLLYLILFLSIGLAVCAITPGLRKYGRPAALALFLSFLAGWMLLGYFHYKIASSLVLIDPTGRLPSGRFYIPVWVENEKFFFWSLALAALVVLSRYRDRLWQSSLQVTLAIFGVMTFFTSNPFSRPLAQFHDQYSQYAAAVATNADMSVTIQMYHGLHGKMVGFYNSSYMWIHPPMVFISYATFVVAFLGCVFMLVRKNGDYERIGYAYAKPGFILLTVGLLLGYPWAVQAWKGEPWWYDPKVNITLMMWVFYSAYLHARLYIHRRGMWTTTAILGYLSFLGVVFTYISTYVIPGIHSVAR